MENAVLQRLRLFIKSKEMSIKKFAESVNSTESSFNTIFQRESNPGTELIIKILNKYPELSVNWLLLGFGAMEIVGNEKVGENSLRASNAMLRLAEDLKRLKEKEKKVPKSTTEMLKMISELSTENGILKERVRALEENINGYANVAEPIIKYGKQ